MKTSCKFNRVRYIMIALCLVSSALLLTSCTGTVRSPASRIYIALGDSVSSGFGLIGYGVEGYSESLEGRHSTIFFENLKNLGYVDEYRNKAVSGFTTTMLLELLNNTDEESLAYFRNANFITLNIGGNNILRPFLEYLSDLDAASGVDSLRSGAEALANAWTIIHEAVSEAEDDDGANEIGIGSVLSGIRNVISGVRDIVSGGRAVAAGAPDAVSVLMGSISAELDAALEEGVEIFLDEFGEIISWLEVNAPNAIIIVNTIYNPIPQAVAGLPIALSGRADELINTMNQAIHEEGGSRGFVVVDINSYFDNRLDLMRLNLDPSSDDFSFDIIHPNREGHIFIAQLHYDYFRAC